MPGKASRARERSERQAGARPERAFETRVTTWVFIALLCGTEEVVRRGSDPESLGSKLTIGPCGASPSGGVWKREEMALDMDQAATHHKGRPPPRLARCSSATSCCQEDLWSHSGLLS